MPPLPDDAQLTSAAKFMRALSQEGVSLLLMLGAGLVVLYAMYELRGQWAPLLWSSPWVGVVGGLAMLSIAGWSAISSLQRRVEVRMAEQLEHARAERGELMERLRKVEISEATCQARVTMLLDEVRTLRTRSRRNDRRDGDHGDDEGTGNG